MQSKVKRLSTLACASFTWLLGVSRERTVSIMRKTCHNIVSHPSLLHPCRGPRCKHLRIANAERQTPLTTLYGTSHISSMEPFSRKRVRSVGGRFIKHYRNA